MSIGVLQNSRRFALGTLRRKLFVVSSKRSGEETSVNLAIELTMLECS